MDGLPKAMRLVMLLTAIPLTAPVSAVPAALAPPNLAAIRGAVVQIAQVVEVVTEAEEAVRPTLLPSGAIGSPDGITLIPSEAGAELSPRGLVLIPTGSGTIVSANGLVLTNEHVVRHGLVRTSVSSWQRDAELQGARHRLRVREDQYAILGLTEPQSSAPPELAYFATRATDAAGQPVAGGAGLDVAILKIGQDRFGEPFITGEFVARSFVNPGDSGSVVIEDAVFVFGYQRGVRTLLQTSGSVTGREQDADWSWIITDADVAPGSSGGAAVDEAGQLIGVPTAVDCVVTDTDADCPVTEVAVVKILPINAAKPLLARAGLEPTPAMTPTTGPTSAPRPPAGTPTPTEAAVPPTGTPASEPTAAGENLAVYESPTYGFVLEYDPDVWELIEVSSDDSIDFVVFSNGPSSVSLRATRVNRDNLGFCLDDFERSLVGVDEDYSPLTGDDGEPIADEDAESAHAAFVSADRDTVVDVVCLVLVEDEATLTVVLWTPEDLYAEQLEARDNLIDGLNLMPDAPESGFVAFPAPQVFHVRQDGDATARDAPNLAGTIVQEFGPGEAIQCDGYVRGDVVAGDDRWLRTSDRPHLYIHASAMAETI